MEGEGVKNRDDLHASGMILDADSMDRVSVLPARQGVMQRGCRDRRDVSRNGKRAGGWPSGACAALLLSIAVLGTPAMAQQQDQLVHLINAFRESPGACSGSVPASAGPLSPEPLLAEVEFSRSGEQALKDAGLPVGDMEAISVSGPSSAAAAMQAIRGRYCMMLAKPEYTLIGVSRKGNTWRVVLARPRLAESATELAGAGKKILELVNAARAEARTCGEKRYPAARPLAWNAALADAASAHSVDMANNNYFAHAAEDGDRAGERAQKAGYRWRRIGENIAAGQSSPGSAVSGWLSSPGHCANLMNPHFTEMGAAYAINKKSDLLIYWTQVFGTPR